MGGTAAGVLALNEVRTRTKLIKVGATAAITYLVMTWVTGLWEHQPIELIRSDGFWRAGWGLMAGFFLGGSLPFLENAFGIVTGISLLELGDITHPLLQELVRRAPGTHNHSITVGAIAEAAAERIGANALLVRIGAYFHDIGKMLKPHYFVENQVGSTSRHANLAPAMSTLIIIGHVKDGVDLGRQHHLPEPIIDLIEQHHGTTLVEYFFHEANRRSGANPDGSAVHESAFRYPGPKPQTREAGILMMADSVESASRSLSEPTPSRIEGLVTDLIDKRLRDGQFDECGLTLREIAEIRDMPDQVADRHLPRPRQVSRATDRLTAAAESHSPCPTPADTSLFPSLHAVGAIAVESSDTQGFLAVDADRLAGLVARVLRDEGVAARVDLGRSGGRRHHPPDQPRPPRPRLAYRRDQLRALRPGDRSWPASWSSRPRWRRPRPKLGADPLAELSLYVVHGLLHLCGYDDTTDEMFGVMRERESVPEAGGTGEHLSPGRSRRVPTGEDRSKRRGRADLDA